MIEIIRIRETGTLWYDNTDKPYFSDNERLPIGKPTAAEYATLCDEKAEDSNYHDFNGTHVALLAILSKYVPYAKVLSIMQDIALKGGLQNIDNPTGD